MNQQPRDQAPEPFGLDDQEVTPAPPAMPPISENEKLLSGLSYVSQPFLPAVLPIVLLLTDEAKRSAFVKYHAVHSLALMIATVIFEIAATIIWVIGTAIAGALCCVLWAIFLVPLVPLIYYGIEAFQGKYVGIPYLTKLLKDNAWV